MVQRWQIHLRDLAVQIEGVGAVEAITEQGAKVMEIGLAVGDGEHHAPGPINAHPIAHIATLVTGNEAGMQCAIEIQSAA